MFGPQTIAFLSDLEGNNSRDWFEANRDRYETTWKAPAEAFQAAMTGELERAFGGRVTPKLFRIHRDVRFSKDKTPYNAHLRMTFHVGGRKDLGWMIGIEPGALVAGFGLFQFSAAQIDVWRAAVDGGAGAELADILEAGQGAGLRLNEPPLKRVPVPYPRDHPRGALLRRKGLALWRDMPVETAFGVDAPGRLAEAMKVFDPLRAWLVAHLPQ